MGRTLHTASTRVSAPAVAPGARIRVGYLSCDFGNHATLHLMAGLLECHDRTHFEIFAYDYSRPEDSAYRRRFLHAIEHHVDVSTMTDDDAARRIADDHLDLLIDLKATPVGGRLGILAYRPAPLQATYLGFPGTTAASFIDYLISDRIVTPDHSTAFYTEKFCRLPHSYQCNDRKRIAVDPPASRTRHHLPDAAIVYCAFNQAYKIDRSSFEVWMRILARVPGSVLWLLAQGESSERNLRRHAGMAGITGERLVFTPFLAPEHHLARLSLADAALDALVCNGHTTTSDALWAGVPVVTVQGAHFCSRVSESLLRAMNLPELVGADANHMMEIAVRIGKDAEYRQGLRCRMMELRTSAPLFDTERFTRHFEQGVRMMVERYRAGARPEHMDVPEFAESGAAEVA